MSAIYSVRFARVTVADTYALWTCPAGYRAVLRNVTAVNAGNTVGVSTAIASGSIVCEAHLQAQTQQSFGDLRVVLYAGEVLGLLNSKEGIHTTAHGYLFRDDGTGAALDFELRPRVPGEPHPS